MKIATIAAAASVASTFRREPRSLTDLTIGLRLRNLASGDSTESAAAD